MKSVLYYKYRQRNRSIDHWARTMQEMEPYERLAGAIILQAVSDYRVIDSKYRNDVEDFFCSQWFEVLSKLDGEFLLEELRKEINEQTGEAGLPKRKTLIK